MRLRPYTHNYVHTIRTRDGLRYAVAIWRGNLGQYEWPTGEGRKVTRSRSLRRCAWLFERRDQAVRAARKLFRGEAFAAEFFRILEEG